MKKEEYGYLLRLQNKKVFESAKALSRLRNQSVNGLINSLLEEEIKINKKNIDKYVSISK